MTPTDVTAQTKNHEALHYEISYCFLQVIQSEYISKALLTTDTFVLRFCPAFW
jgi:hypothetical protein